MVLKVNTKMKTNLALESNELTTRDNIVIYFAFTIKENKFQF